MIITTTVKPFYGTTTIGSGLNRLMKKLNESHIKYVVVGGIALSFHTQPRYTKDIDFLLLGEDIENLKSILKKMGYTLEATPWTFKNTNITLH